MGDSWLKSYSFGLPLPSPPYLCITVMRSDWRSFTTENYRVDTAREEDAARRRGDQPRPAPMQGRPPAAKAPCKGATDYGQASPQGRLAMLARGGSRSQGQHPVGAMPAGRTVARGHNRLQCGARKGGQLQDARKGLPPAASSTANRGSGIGRRGGRP
ncbi:hypothetical protein B296_00019091 [Ensete ventricosum]|uniref:Uncharacterized protein n=1 Tax=Ensete ventricosum TaxID=4639 RepID=A0A426YT10_ENSVE|nr:hypothetical protein B296_00019091 [Ensete ventricosum]